MIAAESPRIGPVDASVARTNLTGQQAAELDAGECMCVAGDRWPHPPHAETRAVEPDVSQRHRDALADTGYAYHAFHGWVLECQWCEFEAVGKTKAEALRGMQRHYDAVLPEGCEIR